MPRPSPQIAMAVIAVVVLLIAFMPQPMIAILKNIAAFWDAALLVAAALTLLWFVYWVFLRKMVRARHIANLRFKRRMDEIAQRDPAPDRPE